MAGKTYTAVPTTPASPASAKSEKSPAILVKSPVILFDETRDGYLTSPTEERETPKACLVLIIVISMLAMVASLVGTAALWHGAAGQSGVARFEHVFGIVRGEPCDHETQHVAKVDVKEQRKMVTVQGKHHHTHTERVAITDHSSHSHNNLKPSHRRSHIAAEIAVARDAAHPVTPARLHALEKLALQNAPKDTEITEIDIAIVDQDPKHPYSSSQLSTVGHQMIENWRELKGAMKQAWGKVWKGLRTVADVKMIRVRNHAHAKKE